MKCARSGKIQKPALRRCDRANTSNHVEVIAVLGEPPTNSEILKPRSEGSAARSASPSEAQGGDGGRDGGAGGGGAGGGGAGGASSAGSAGGRGLWGGDHRNYRRRPCDLDFAVSLGRRAGTTATLGAVPTNPDIGPPTGVIPGRAPGQQGSSVGPATGPTLRANPDLQHQAPRQQPAPSSSGGRAAQRETNTPGCNVVAPPTWPATRPWEALHASPLTRVFRAFRGTRPAATARTADRLSQHRSPDEATARLSRGPASGSRAPCHSGEASQAAAGAVLSSPEEAIITRRAV
jgi:hypothetical protein